MGAGREGEAKGTYKKELTSRRAKMKLDWVSAKRPFKNIIGRCIFMLLHFAFARAVVREHFWTEKKLLVEKGGVHLSFGTPDLRRETCCLFFLLQPDAS